jgi:pimeloyl-ACP methyl ester carboxylesterase
MLLAAMLPAAVSELPAQQTCQPRMEQDQTLDNLVHPAGYATAEPGTLGGVLRVGDGPVDMVLIAGAGFGGEIFEGFMEANASQFRMLAVTLPGFGGTPAPPMPPARTSYGELSWTRSAQEAVARLIVEEELDRPVVVGHWLSATPIAMGLAVERPDLVRGAIVISGVPKFVPMSGTGMTEPGSLAQRVAMVDQYLAPQWFRTVTRATWDDNNFLPRDYAIHPLRGQQLWMEAAQPTLPVWIRYLCESWAQDSTSRLVELQVPVLILKPELDELYHQGPQMGDYLESFMSGWDGAEKASHRIQVETIADSRVFIMDDQPQRLHEAVSRFVRGPAAEAVRVAVQRRAPRTMAAPAGGPGIWGGAVRRDGDRYVLTDAGVSLQGPDSWEFEPLVQEAPLLARLRDPAGKSEVTVQVRSTMGMDLAALIPMVESGLAQQMQDYEHVQTAQDTLAGRHAYRMEFRYAQDGETMQTIVLVTMLDETQMISLTIKAPAGDIDAFRRAFDGIGRSLALEDAGR